MFPRTRLRRLRRTPAIRTLVRETQLQVSDLVLPLFVVPGRGVRKEISSMPGNYHLSVDELGRVVECVTEAGVPAVLLFGLPEAKDDLGSEAWAETGVVQRAVAEIKRLAPDLCVITDVCLCEYTSHGHCGQLDDQGNLLNDATLDLLSRVAVSHAQSGADIVAPSDMMDGRVGAIRSALDDAGLTQTAILSYAVKYASGFYGPFREAADSAPQFGDRSAYQMDPANAREALREAALDIDEGADLIMVKPALSYLDVIRTVADTFPVPVAAYNVSGEFAMVKAAAERGWIDERRVALEILTSIKRAGAHIILTYHALDVARWLKEQAGC
ncbi:MAG: porphobilinogen synthase [Armatimonadetes bacterium]|nr:porphobilinogen synthase [Armatimonadota bacterium]